MLIFPLLNDLSRKIIHIDMDAFFAAVEIRDNPKLRGKPVIIGSDPRQTGGRGVVSTCSYEARAFGVHSAMSSKEAYERCPQAVFISGNYEKYKAVGLQIRAIFKRYTDLIEPMSIDEAYLDVTENKLGIKSAVKIARLIQKDIWQELHLTASAGISYNKFLAKMASDYQKPHGLTVILPEQAEDFLKQMNISKFHGVGKKTVERLHQMGVFTGADLLEVPEVTLIDRFGRLGYDLYRKARGIHNSYLDIYQLVEIVASLSQVDEKRLSSYGASQGGALALVAAALNPRIQKTVAIYPFLSDFRRVIEIGNTSEAYDELFRYFKFYDPFHETEEEIMATLAYIDVKNLAHRIQGEVKMITGLDDDVCYPITQFAIYNRLTCDKTYRIMPEYAHEAMNVFVNDQVYNWLCGSEIPFKYLK
ncbi:DNA polymerase IV [Streptococcus pneumoniae]|nr:DNA polymerase IV [Streptococcus pneumoniae]